MTGCEPGFSGSGSDRAVNCATTTTQRLYSCCHHRGLYGCNGGGCVLVSNKCSASFYRFADGIWQRMLIGYGFNVEISHGFGFDGVLHQPNLKCFMHARTDFFLNYT